MEGGVGATHGGTFFRAPLLYARSSTHDVNAQHARTNSPNQPNPQRAQVNEACCEAHKRDFVARPDLEAIVHYDAWARRWVKEHVDTGAFKKVLTVV